MSLWEIMDSPFRLLDEFDVFMDLFNRKMVMEMLIDLATKEYKSNQFLFFTPQGVKEVVSREGVQIFEMPKLALRTKFVFQED
ncbi:hypothetical protein AB6A40_009035 [Gnathostoma spinigerum]|uniref:Uncharacterized protein n=1 Tax=Gnathostoma spinigerum TaxID=75299 RepID=A0ABD6ER47_9BILA